MDLITSCRFHDENGYKTPHPGIGLESRPDFDFPYPLSQIFITRSHALELDKQFKTEWRTTFDKANQPLSVRAGVTSDWYWHRDQDTFACSETFALSPDCQILYAFYQDNLSSPNGYVYIYISYKTDEDLKKAIKFFEKELTQPKVTDGAPSVSVAFWAYTHNGPSESSRSISSYALDDILENYSPHTQGVLKGLKDYKPKRGGDLILLSGSAGTGKTSALRALFYEWRSWADFHYVIDPTTLFGGSPDYLRALIMKSCSAPPNFDSDADIIKSSTPSSKWRILLLEDVGELITSDAKQNVGQGLAQLLNVTDGFLGQGLRIILIITTNEKVERLHSAVSRPGRCLVNHIFKPLTKEESATWLTNHNAADKIDNQGHTIAELYSLISQLPNYRDPEGTKDSRPIGFTS
jgi:hypothetical protein